MKLPLHPLFVSFATSVLVAGVCACSTAAAGSAPVIPSAATRSVRPSFNAASLAAFANRIGVTCDTHGSHRNCITGKPEVGDYLDVELRQTCTLQAVVAAKKAELRDRAAPLDRRTVAVLDRGRRLCIEAIGRAGDHPEYYYVTTIADQSLACRNDHECGEAGDHRIHWVQPARSDCSPRLLAVGQMRCAAGWLEAEEVQVLRSK